MTDADDVVRLVQQVLGPEVLGAYQHGSAVLGGLQPTSDIDVLVVLPRPTTEPERRAIVEELLDVSGARARRLPGRPVELSLVVHSDVQPWRFPPRRDMEYGEWLRHEYEAGLTPGANRCPDLAVLLTMVLQSTESLHGPPPQELLDPVPPADLRAGMLAGIASLLADLADDTRNVLLTLARIRTTLATGTITRKDSAAAAAALHLPPALRPVLDRAAELYLGGRYGPWDDLPVQAAAQELVDQIRQLSG